MSWVNRSKKGRGPDRRSLLSFGIFAVVTALLTAFIAQQILSTSFNDRYELTATFDDVTGLLTGDQVKVSGVPVGRVNSIKIKYGKALVVMEVDKGIKVPDDSTAAVQWRNVIGQRVVYLRPGQGQAMLKDGDQVKHTQAVVDLSDIVNAVGPLTRSLDPDMVNKLLVAFSQTLDGNEGNINVMIDNVDALLKTFGQRSATIKQMLRNYQTVAGAVATRDRQIAASVDNLEQLSKVFAGNSRLLDGALVEISGVTTTLNQVLGGNDVQLGRIIENLTSFSETARLKIDKLESMVQNLPLALRQLFAAGNGGHFLRTNALCLNIVQGPCPFPMRFPKTTTPNGQNTWTPQDEAKLKRMLLGAGTGGR